MLSELLTHLNKYQNQTLLHILTLQSSSSLRSLKSELSGWDENHDLNHVLLRVRLLQRGNDKSGSLSSSVFGSCKNVSSCCDCETKNPRREPTQENRTSQCDGYTFFLDRGWFFEPFLENAHQKFCFQVVVLEVVSFRCRDILHISNVTRFELVIKHCRHSRQSFVGRPSEATKVSPSSPDLACT